MRVQNNLLKQAVTTVQYLWAEVPMRSGNVICQRSTLPHTEWFRQMGLPSWGNDFDRTARGIIKIDKVAKTAVIETYHPDFAPREVWQFFRKKLPADFKLDEQPYQIDLDQRFASTGTAQTKALKLFKPTFNHPEDTRFIYQNGVVHQSPENHYMIAETSLPKELLSKAEGGYANCPAELENVEIFLKTTGAVRVAENSETRVGLHLVVPPTAPQLRRMAEIARGKKVYWTVVDNEGQGTFADFQRALDSVFHKKFASAEYPPELNGLAAEAKKCSTFKEFEHNFSMDLKHGRYYHLTDNPNFTIDSTKGPRDMSSMAGGQMETGKLMITSHLENWDAYYNWKDEDTEEVTRPYVAIIDMSQVPRNSYHQVSRGFGNEFWVEDPSKAKVIKVVPIAEGRADAAHDQDIMGQYINSKEDLEEFYNWAKGIKTAAVEVDMNLINSIVDEYMPVLKPSLPKPEIKISNGQSNVLGECVWRYGYHTATGESFCGDNTTITLQRRICGDERTLRRIIAHELAHHEDSLVNEVADFKEKGYQKFVAYRKMFRPDHHGPKWLSIAARFNAKYGKNFVTRTSDQTMVTDDTDLKPCYVLIEYYDGQLMWQVANRLSPKAKQYLGELAEGEYLGAIGKGHYEHKLFMSSDPILIKKGAPLVKYNGWSTTRTEGAKERLEELWNNGTDILSQFKPQEKTAAPISQNMKSQIYFHGTGNEASAQAIIREGIQPREIIMPDKAKSRSQLAPVPDRVYLTTNFGYASIYAMGGQYFGLGMHDQTKTNYTADMWLKNHTKEGAYGYVFEIHGSQLTGDVVPDEDSIGEALEWLAEDIKGTQRLNALTGMNDVTGKADFAPQKEKWQGELESLKRSMEIVKQQRINQPDVPKQVRTELYHLYIWRVTDNQKRKLQEIGTQAQVGKKLQKLLSQETCQWMIENGAHVAHRGPIIPTKCWRFSKEKALYTLKLGEILEEVPLPAQKTAKDFGYTKYRNREKDLQNVKFVSQGLEREHLGVAAKYNGEDIGAIECSVVAKLCVVCNVWINGDWRGTGLGQLLYDHAIQAAKKAGLLVFSSDDQLTDDAASAWLRLGKRYPLTEVDNLEYDPDAEYNGEVPQHPVRYHIDLNRVPTKNLGTVKKASPDFGYSRFNNREGELAQVEITLSNVTEFSFQVDANYNGKLIAWLTCSAERGNGNWNYPDYSVDAVNIMDNTWKGTGLGQMLYDRAIQEAKGREANYFYSDTGLSPPARSAWNRLKQRYPVESLRGKAEAYENYNPEAKNKGLYKVPRLRIDLNKVAAISPADRTLYHGTNDEQEFDTLKPTGGDPVVWLGELDTARDIYSRTIRGGRERVFEVKLKPDAKIADLLDVNQPITKKVQDYFLRCVGSRIWDHGWPDIMNYMAFHRHDHELIPLLKEAGFDGAIVMDKGRPRGSTQSREHHSVALWNMDAIESQQEIKTASASTVGSAFWNKVQEDALAGIVYHGTTLEVADLILSTGFRGLEWDAILKDVLAKYNMTETDIPKKMFKVLQETKRSYEAEAHLVSTSPGGNVALRWAGSGGEVPQQIEAYILGKYSPREVKNSRLHGEPAILKCRIKEFQSTPHYTRIKQSVDGLNRLIADGGITGVFSPHEAAEDMWGTYTNFLCKPEELEVVEIITGARLQELSQHPLGVSVE